MRVLQSSYRLSLVVAAFGLSLMVSGLTAAGATRVKFENGMEVIFKENHSSPMITSIVFVRAGAKYETNYNNGVTHLL